MRFARSLLLGGLALLLVPSPSEAQIRASEPATMIQTIDGTTFRIDYFRPRARGRTPLFGGDEAVVWEHVWTPGANWATKISFQKPIEFEGVSIEPGIYSLWVDMDENLMPEEFFFEPDTLIFHTMGPPEADDQIRFPVELEDGYPFREVLTWDFEDISSTGGVLAVRWGTHRMAFDIKVEPSQRMAATPEEAAPILGKFEGQFMGPEGPEGPTFTMAVSQDADGIIHADLEGVPAADGSLDPFFNSLDMWLLPGGADGWFIPGESYEPGVLRETWAGYFMEFELGDGPSPSFVLRDDLDRPFITGKRVN
jgi:hypothetical protein